MPGIEARTGYAPVGELDMYYEIHGSGRPLILLHGAYMTIDMMEPLLSRLAKTCQVIAVEQQGHGRTAGVDRPLMYEQMADDTAALSRHLEIASADFVGYSLGGGVALQLAIRHPALVRNSSSRPRPSPATACTPLRSICSRRSHSRCSPGLRSRRRIAGPRPALTTSPSWWRSSSGSTRRPSRGRRRTSGPSLLRP